MRDIFRLCLLALIEEDGVDVAFKMIDGDEWFAESEGERFGEGDADKKCSGKTGAAGDGDSIEVGERDSGFRDGGADNGEDGAKMLSTGELGHNAAEARVRGDLRGDDRRKRLRAARDDSCGGFVAGAFNAENEAGGHSLLV